MKTIKIDIKKKDGEYCVRWLENGQRIEAKCYYTDDLQDAKDTMKLSKAFANTIYKES